MQTLSPLLSREQVAARLLGGGEGSPALPDVGDEIDGFVVERKLGRGAMSSVVSARHTGTGQRVALKVLLPHLASNETVLKMLLDEANIVRRIDHENVARILTAGNWRGTPYLGLELVEGWSYARVIRRAAAQGFALPVGFHLAVLARAAAGLAAAHAATDESGQRLRVVHRDVKPENILIGFDGSVKVSDFGVAAARRRFTATRPGAVKGTISYMAPEQINTAPSVDHRADLWALCVIGWEVFAQRSLFRSDSFATAMLGIIYGTAPELGELATAVPEDVTAVIMRCLAKDPAARPSSALDIAYCFAHAAVGLGWGDPRHIGALLWQLRARVEADRYLESAPTCVMRRPPERSALRRLQRGLAGLCLVGLASLAGVSLVQRKPHASLRPVVSSVTRDPLRARADTREEIPTLELDQLPIEPPGAHP